MKTGRPRLFDKDSAVDQALKLFWRKGYEGTSLSDLTEAMHINRPSLYAAFGNKESLFKLALDRYASLSSVYTREALEQPTARKTAEHLLIGAINSQAKSKNPAGCLLVHGALACGEEADCVKNELTARRNAGNTALRKRFERAIKEGDLPSSANAADLARFITTVIFGMAVQSAGGVSRRELTRITNIAMKAWPAR